jgi:hypothetical protein
VSLFACLLCLIKAKGISLLFLVASVLYDRSFSKELDMASSSKLKMTRLFYPLLN